VSAGLKQCGLSQRSIWIILYICSQLMFYQLMFYADHKRSRKETSVAAGHIEVFESGSTHNSRPSINHFIPTFSDCGKNECIKAFWAILE